MVCERPVAGPAQTTGSPRQGKCGPARFRAAFMCGWESGTIWRWVARALDEAVDAAFPSKGNSKMDPGFRRDDEQQRRHHHGMTSGNA